MTATEREIHAWPVQVDKDMRCDICDKRPATLLVCELEIYDDGKYRRNARQFLCQPCRRKLEQDAGIV